MPLQLAHRLCTLSKMYYNSLIIRKFPKLISTMRPHLKSSTRNCLKNFGLNYALELSLLNERVIVHKKQVGKKSL